jgi:hypothetical protein
MIFMQTKNTTPITPEQRIQRALRRHLRHAAAARLAYQAADAAIQLALRHGAQPGFTFKLGGIDHILVDHSATLRVKGSLYRPARLPCWTVEPLHKTKAKAEPSVES